MPRLIFGATVLAGLAALLLGPAIGQETDSPRGAAAKARPAGSSTASLVIAQRSRVILDQEAVLASDRPGILKFVEPEEGDRVTAGQQVAGLKDEVLAAALAVATKMAESTIDVRYAEKAAGVADQELEKALLTNRLSPGNIPEVDVERLRLSAERARLQIEKAAHDKQIAELQRDEKAAELQTYRVIAPLDGIVTEVLKQPGEAVQQGDPILRIVRTDVVRVEGFVTVAEAFRVQPGDPVTVRLDASQLPGLPQSLSDLTFEGKVSFVDPTARVVSNGVRIWATVPNEGNLLKAGLPAMMEIQSSGELSAALEASRNVGQLETRP